MKAASGIVPGSPVYIDNVTGQMKVFIDRLADAIHYQTLSGKSGCAVTTTWSSGGEDVVFYLNHVLNYLGILALEGISVAIGNDPEVIYREEEKARKLGERLAWALRTREKYPGQPKIIEENRSFLHGLWSRTVNGEPMSIENGSGRDGSIEQFFCCQLLQLSEMVNHEPWTI